MAEEEFGWFREAFKAKGYQEGKDLIIEFREANGHYSLLPNLVAELLALKPDVIIAEATPAIAAAQRAISTIPIIMSPSTDPIGSGFVKSFAKPGGNITGIANMFADLTAKMLDIIRLLFSKVQKIGVLASNNPTHMATFEGAARAAGAIGVSAQRFVAPNPEDLDKAFAGMQAAGCQVVYVLADPIRRLSVEVRDASQIAAAFRMNLVHEHSGPSIQFIFCAEITRKPAVASKLSPGANGRYPVVERQFRGSWRGAPSARRATLQKKMTSGGI